MRRKKNTCSLMLTVITHVHFAKKLSNKAMQLYLIGTITESFSSNINDSCLSL